MKQTRTLSLTRVLRNQAALRLPRPSRRLTDEEVANRQLAQALRAAREEGITYGRAQ